MNLTNKLVLAAAGGIAVLDVLVRVESNERVRRLERNIDKIGLASDRLDNLTHLDISDKVAEEAMNRAAEKYADIYARNAAEKVTIDANSYIRGVVNKAVAEKSEAIKADVKDTIAKRVSYINIDDLKKEVKKEAKDELLDKLEDMAKEEMSEMSDEFKRAARAYGAFNSLFKD